MEISNGEMGDREIERESREQRRLPPSRRL